MLHIKISSGKKHTTNVKDNVWISDNLETACVVGVLRPTVYLPAALYKGEAALQEIVLSHEKMHIHRHDNLWKFIFFAALSMHWLNPIICLSYVLFSEDIELACDESVVVSMTKEERKKYAYAILSQVSKCKMKGYFSFFCKNKTAERIEHVLKVKKVGVAKKLCGKIALRQLWERL